MTCPLVGTIPEGPVKNGNKCDAWAFDACMTYEQERDPRGVLTLTRRGNIEETETEEEARGSIDVTGVCVWRASEKFGEVELASR